MKGLISEDKEYHFIYSKEVFIALENEQKDYNWLITNFVCYPNTKKYSEIFSINRDYCWISGEELTK